MLSINIHIPTFYNFYLFSVIGYGMTDTGKTVLSGILIGTLALTALGFIGAPGRSARKRQFTLQKRRRQFIDDCQINPHLPHCVDSIEKGRVLQKRRKLKRN